MTTTEPTTTEHYTAYERSTRWQHDPIEVLVHVPVTRFACTCGKRGKWWREEDDALRDAVRHALSGQLSFDV